VLVELNVTEQRYRAVLEVQAGVPVTEVADRFGVSRQAVHRWVVALRAAMTRRNSHTLVMSKTGRRRVAIGLAIAAPLMMAATIVAHANPAYVYARPADRPQLIVGLAALMLAIAARLALARRALRVTTYVITGLVALPGIGLGLAQEVASAAFGGGPIDRGTVATASGFEVAAYQEPVLFRSDVLVLRVRTRAGPLSREGDEVACFMAPGTNVPSSWLFGQAQFTALNRLQVSAADGTTYWLTFDTRSLNAADEVDRCSTAPDPKAD
jgi:hypothetical protein